MRRKRLRFRAKSRAGLRLGGIFRAVTGGGPRAAAGRRFRLRHVAGLLFAVVAVLVTAAAVFVVVQLLRPVPAMTMTGLAARLRVLPGVPPRPAGRAGRRPWSARPGWACSRRTAAASRGPSRASPRS